MTAKTKQEYIDSWYGYIETLNGLMKTKGNVKHIKVIKEDLRMIVLQNATVLYRNAKVIA